MKLKYITNEKYNQLLFKCIAGETGASNEIVISANGYPSIGFNFNLKEPTVLYSVLASLGFDVKGSILTGQALAAEKYYIDLILSALNIVSCRDADSLKRIINNIVQTRAADERYKGLQDFRLVEQFVFEKQQDIVTSLASVIAFYEKRLDQWLGSFSGMDQQLFAKSKERAALFSLTFQSVIGFNADQTPKFEQLGQALLEQNRAQCWYQIR